MDPFRALADQTQRAFERDPLFRPHTEFAFERLEKIGAGGMGVVYRVIDRRFKREAALKVLMDARSAPGKVERFVREARVMARLDHPSIPALYEYGRGSRGQVFILMKLVKGETLRQRIRALHELSGEGERRAALSELLEAVGQVCKALQYAHSRGVLHRDVKPENIMIGRHGEVYLMDWGIARDLKESAETDQRFRASVTGVDESLFDQALTAERCVIGTFGAMPPEQARGEELDARADVYSLGAVLFEIMANRPPISATGTAGRVAAMSGRLDIPADFGRGFPVELTELALQCLSQDREGRPKSPGVVRRRLPRRSARARKPGAARPRAPILAALFALLLAVLFASLYWQERGARQAGEAARGDLAALRQRLAEAAAPRPKPVTTPPAAGAKTEYTYNPRPETEGSEAADRASLDEYSRAIAAAPEDAAAHRNRGLIYLRLKENRLALADFSRAIALAPGDGEAYLNRGVARMNLADDDGAYEDFTQAIALDPRYSKAYCNRGVLFNRKGDRLRAIEDYTRAIDCDPEYSEAYKNRGVVHLANGDHTKALADLSRAIALRPRDADAYINRAVAHAGLSRHREAIADCDEGIALAPESGGTYINRALSLDALGRLDEALADLERCLEVEPTIATAAAVRAGIAQLERRIAARR